MRGTWGRLFSMMGNRLTDDALEDFQKAIEKQLDSEVETWMKSLFS